MSSELSFSFPVVLIGPDGAFLEAVADAFNPKRGPMLTVIPDNVENAAFRPELEAAFVVVVDLDVRRRESLAALQGLITRIPRDVPVIVLVDSFDDSLARWFLQVRVADFLKKPIDPKEVLRACIRALRATSSADLPEVQSQIHSFLPAAGGVGTTTLAIETAMLQLKAHNNDEDSVCLVDLDFDNGSCADYLDVEPRLDLTEIGQQVARLDAQLMEVMLSRHSSGLALLCSRGRPARAKDIDPLAVARLLDLASSKFDHVIIDLPRAFEGWTDQVLMGSNKVFIISDMTVPGVRLARRMANAISDKLSDVQPRVIVNRAEKLTWRNMLKPNLRRVDVERALEGLFAGFVTNHYQLVREAIDRGVSLETVKPGNVISSDLKKIIFS